MSANWEALDRAGEHQTELQWQIKELRDRAAELRRALAAEREECAKIADQSARDNESAWPNWAMVARNIARDIRARAALHGEQPNQGSSSDE